MEYDDAESVHDLNDHHIKVETEEILKIIENEIDRLPVKQKEVFLLRQHGEMTFSEIAVLTNQPLNTVLSHMHYAVNRLKRVFKEKR